MHPSGRRPAAGAPASRDYAAACFGRTTSSTPCSPGSRRAATTRSGSRRSSRRRCTPGPTSWRRCSGGADCRRSTACRSPSRTTSTSPGCPPPPPAPRSPTPPTGDAGSVARLLAAGAIVVGKTNLDQFATGLNGTRSPYGARESVFGGDLISGGSSSGSAVAVAAGLGHVRAGHRHRRLGPGAGRDERDRRAQADPRARRHQRRAPGLPLAGLRQRVHPRRRRRGRPCSRCSPGRTRTTRGRAPPAPPTVPGRPPGSPWPTALDFAGDTAHGRRVRRGRRRGPPGRAASTVHVPVEPLRRGRRPALHRPVGGRAARRARADSSPRTPTTSCRSPAR